MLKKTSLICFSLLASSLAVPGLSHAQFVLPTPPQQEQEAAPVIPDEVHLVLMIRSAVVALNQANLTGNYTVLREMGTANFQMTNSPARLAEIFATLRSRKIDLAPVMVFSPKLTSTPALDGQVLRLAGFFPTTPEQVQFDLAYQHAGEQWLLAGIAISVAPPSDGAQASTTTGGQLLQASAEPGLPAQGKPGDAKQIHIDLSLPAQAQGNANAAKKPPVAKKPKPPAPPQKTAASQSVAPAPSPDAPTPAPAAQQPAPAESSQGGVSWNPFGR